MSKRLSFARQIVLFCGSDCFPFEILTLITALCWSLARLIDRSPHGQLEFLAAPSHRLLRAEVDRDDEPSFNSPVSKIVKTRFRPELGWRLIDLVESFQNWKCSIVHDKVYALIGLLSDPTYGRHPIPRVFADYDSTTVDVFARTLLLQDLNGYLSFGQLGFIRVIFEIAPPVRLGGGMR